MQDPTEGWVDPSYELAGPELEAFVKWIKEEGQDRSGAGIAGDIKPLQQMDYTHGPSVQQSQGIRVLLSDADAPEGVKELGLVDALLQITGDSELEDIKNELDQDIFILIENNKLDLKIFIVSLSVNVEYYVSTFNSSFSFPEPSFSSSDELEKKYDAIEETDGATTTFTIDGNRAADAASVYHNGVFVGVTSTTTFTFDDAPLSNSTVEFVGHFVDPTKQLDAYAKQASKGTKEIEATVTKLDSDIAAKETDLNDWKVEVDAMKEEKLKNEDEKAEQDKAHAECKDQMREATTINKAEEKGKCAIDAEIAAHEAARNIEGLSREIDVTSSNISVIEGEIAAMTAAKDEIQNLSWQGAKATAESAIANIKASALNMPEGPQRDDILEKCEKVLQLWSAYDLS